MTLEPTPPPPPQTPPARRRPSRRAVAFVVVLDLVIGTGVGFGTYFANREFGAPTAPLDVTADAATCVPDDCDLVSSSVMLTWSPPLYGGSVATFVILRDGQELVRLGAGATEYVDEEVVPGASYEYALLAVGEEGRGPQSTAAVADVPTPPISAAQVAGEYRVVVKFLRIDLLLRYEGVKNPSAGDTIVQIWNLDPVCTSSEGACNVELFGEGPLKPRGTVYEGRVPTDALCGKQEVRSTKTVVFRVTKAKMVGTVLTSTAFEGTTETDFRCGGRKVHAVAEITGTRAVP